MSEELFVNLRFVYLLSYMSDFICCNMLQYLLCQQLLIFLKGLSYVLTPITCANQICCLIICFVMG